MKIETSEEDARRIIESQLDDFAELAKKAAESFKHGNHRAAYHHMPFVHPALGNLETYVSEKDNMAISSSRAIQA